MGLRASILKPTPFIYLAFEKNGHIHILDHLKCWPIHILPVDFCTHLLLVVKTNNAVNSLNTKRTSSLKNFCLKNMCIYRDVRKSWAFHIPIKKNWVSHILFVEKRGPIIYLAVLKKGAFRHAHPHYAIYMYRKSLPHPLPPPHPLGPLQKPTDLDLHCMQRQGISGFTRTRDKNGGFLKGNNLFSEEANHFL